MALAPDHTEKDHIQLIRGTLSATNVQPSHIYIYIHTYIYTVLYIIVYYKNTLPFAFYTSAKVCKNFGVLCHGFVLACGLNLLSSETYYIDFAAPTQRNFKVLPM